MLKKSKKLTDKQELFCLYYIESFNATRAYKRAYKCSYSVAVVNACRLLTNANIKAKINKLIKECLNKQKIKSFALCNRVLQEYINIAFADIGDYVEFGQREVDNKKVNYLDLKDSKNLDTTIIQEIRTGQNETFIKLYDKMKALEFLYKQLATDLATKEKIEILKQKLELEKQKFNYLQNKTNTIEQQQEKILIEMLKSFKK